MTQRAPRPRKQASKPPQPEKRHFIAEWALQLLILLFGSTLRWCRRSIVPTGSMETTVLSATTFGG